MQTSVRFLALILAAAIAAQCQLRAATFDATIGGVGYTIVEIDPFSSGGSVGNTSREDGSGTFWTSDFGVGDDGLWHQRAYSTFNTGYASLPGATNRIFEASWENAAALRINVSGLPAPAPDHVYQASLLYTTFHGGSAVVGTQAALNDLAANGTFYATGQAVASLGSGNWRTSIAPLGTTELGATSFYVGIDEFGGADRSIERSHALAIAYRQVPYADEDELDRGHRVLIERGLQVQALGFVSETGYFDAARWAESNFTTIDSYYGYAAELPRPAPGIPWSRWALAGELTNPANFDLTPAERPFASNLVRLQIEDEQDITDPAKLATAAAAVQAIHAKYPNVIVHTNQIAFQQTPAEVQSYMAQVKPDMLMFDFYPFDGLRPGGSPLAFYNGMAKFRALGLKGNDGTGDRPIPTGLYTQTYIDPNLNNHVVSESEIRLNNFSAWAFGYKLVDAFVYDDPNDPNLQSAMFVGKGTTNPTPQFYQVAETNRQSLNLGPALVRLITTDVRMKMGRHGANAFNTLPEGVTSWDTTADPYITGVTATNLGRTNNRREGDVIVGYLKPLDEAFTNPGHADDIYFMVVNGLTSATGSAADCQQRIRLTFDFGDSGIDSLLRLSRLTGVVEEVALTPLGGSRYSLDLVLDGGTGDLFKFNNGGVFVGMPVPELSTTPLLSLGIAAMFVAWRRESEPWPSRIDATTLD